MAAIAWDSSCAHLASETIIGLHLPPAGPLASDRTAFRVASDTTRDVDTNDTFV